MEQITYWKGEVSLFKRAIQYEPHLGRVHILLAKAYYLNRRYDHAITEYEKAAEIMNRYASLAKISLARDFYLGLVKGIYFDWAHCYEAKKDFEASSNLYQMALTLDPLDGVLYNNLGENYFYLRKIDLAITQFKKTLELNPSDLQAMNNLALCYIEQGHLNEAEQLLKAILEKNNRFLPARQNLEKLLNDRR